MDNGSLELRGVRLPRFHMCSRFARVERQPGGQGAVYVKVPDAHPKIAYLTMMQVRGCVVSVGGSGSVGWWSPSSFPSFNGPPCTHLKQNKTQTQPNPIQRQVRALIVVVASRDLSKAATIATRYAAVRRQGFDESGAYDVMVDWFAWVVGGVWWWRTTAVNVCMWANEKYTQQHTPQTKQARLSSRSSTTPRSSTGSCRCWPPRWPSSSRAAPSSVCSARRRRPSPPGARTRCV